MKKLVFTLFFLLLTTYVFSQNNPDLIKHVLLKHEIGKIFTFKSSNQYGALNVMITYLGTVATLNHKVCKIITWGNVWGPNHHSNGVIYLFNSHNEYFGEYELGDITDLPSKIEGNDLIFENKNKLYCDTSLVTKISFDSIPKNIFLICTKDGGGDIYSFSSASVDTSSFQGNWSSVKNNARNSFVLTLEKRKKYLVGFYCGIRGMGAIRDCPQDEFNFPPSFKVIYPNTTEFITNFHSTFSKAIGKVKITLTGDTLYWNIIQQPSGEFIAPLKAKMVRKKSNN